MTDEKVKTSTNGKVRDSVFKDLFSDESSLLQLYQSLHPEDDTATAADPQNVTLRPVRALSGLFDDLSFTVRDKLVILTASQAELSEAIAFRMLELAVSKYGEYLSRMKQDCDEMDDLVFPKSELYLLYVGELEFVPKEVDMANIFGAKSDEVSPRSMRIKVYSTQTGNIRDLLEKRQLPSAEELDMLTDPALLSGDFELAIEKGSPASAVDWTKMADGRHANILEQYMAFCRLYTKELKICKTPLEAIEATIWICIRHGILREYLLNRGREVKRILNNLYSEEKIIRLGIENARKEAREEERTMILELLQQNGLLSSEQMLELQNELAACDAEAARDAGK